ncbi:MAG TPA: polysaccharide deacetylase family protein [Steroidobacteraceae bacterium]|nr:polysaccharide deacetylase family protein [Steroidobacteraceae bacterium]
MTPRPGNLAPKARPWRPAPAIGLSLLLHVAGVAALVLLPSHWPWVLGGLATNHLLLIAAVLWPRGRVLGPNLVRLPSAAAARNEVSLNFDDGPDPEVTPRVLDLLDRHRARANFFCIGEKAAAFPELVKEIARRGHSVENHTHRHASTFAFYGLGRLRREVEAAQATIAGIIGRAPEFFRAPAGFRSPLLDPVMAACGLHYVSWTRRGFDTVHGNADAVLRRLTRGLAPGDILLLHDGASARTRAGEPVVLAVLPALLDQLAARGLKPVTLPEACRDESTA